MVQFAACGNTHYFAMLAIIHIWEFHMPRNRSIICDSRYAIHSICHCIRNLWQQYFCQAPVPITSWKPKVIDAFQYGNSCIQQSAAIGFWGPQSEDCLYLNVFVPGDDLFLRFDSSYLKSVMIIFSAHKTAQKIARYLLHSWRRLFGRFGQ